MVGSTEAPRGWKPKLMHELKLIGAIGAYIWLALICLQMYKLMVVPGASISNFQFGYNAIEALLLAKVIIIGDLLHIGEKLRGRPLIIPTLSRSFAFGILVLLFSSLEFVIKAMVDGAGFVTAFQELMAKENGERAVHAAFMFLAFIPLFAIWELAHVVGETKLTRMFFREAPPA